MNLLELPVEILYHHILISIPVIQLSLFARVNSKTHKILNKQDFWILKLKYDYPLYKTIKDHNLKDQYNFLQNYYLVY